MKGSKITMVIKEESLNKKLESIKTALTAPLQGLRLEAQALI